MKHPAKSGWSIMTEFDELEFSSPESPAYCSLLENPTKCVFIVSVPLIVCEETFSVDADTKNFLEPSHDNDQVHGQKVKRITACLASTCWDVKMLQGIDMYMSNLVDSAGATRFRPSGPSSHLEASSSQESSNIWKLCVVCCCMIPWSLEQRCPTHSIVRIGPR